jgi:hypothetical protein
MFFIGWCLSMELRSADVVISVGLNGFSFR